jgi:general secretion pathway protein F
MAAPDQAHGRTVSIAQLQALCDEIAALVRAGVPLEQGLASAGSELPGRLGSLAHSLEQRLQRGEDLPTALRSMPGKFPDFFVSLVEAGIRSGRLGLALEGMAATGRQMNELRNSIILAMMYPVTLFFVAYILLFAVVSRVAERINEFYVATELVPSRWSRAVAAFGRIDWVWHALFLLAVVVVMLVWLWATRRARLLQGEHGTWALGWLWSARCLLADGRACSFADILALLLLQEVPSPVALRLAGQASGSRQLAAAAERAASGLELGKEAPCDNDFPPRLRWWVAALGSPVGASSSQLARGLRRFADVYRERVLNRAEWLRIYVPMFATLIIGGMMAVIYFSAVLYPWWMWLYHMGEHPLRII